MKARDSSVVLYREERVNWIKKQGGEKLLFKATKL